MALDQATLDAVDAWAAQMMATGRVATRYPSGVLAGQLASRLETPDPTLGPAPAAWDYQLAPFLVRVADNLSSTSDDVTLALMDYSNNVLGFTADLASAAGAVTHVVVQTAGDAVAAAIGIPAWMLWAGLAVGSYYVLTNVGATKRYVRELVA